MQKRAFVLTLLLAAFTAKADAFVFSLDRLVVYLDTEAGGQLEIVVVCGSSEDNVQVLDLPALTATNQIFVTDKPVDALDIDLMPGEVTTCYILDTDERDFDADAFDFNADESVDVIGVVDITRESFDVFGFASFVGETSEAIFFCEECMG